MGPWNFLKMKTLTRMMRWCAPKIWIQTFKIIPDLWLVDLFWRIKKNVHTPPYWAQTVPGIVYSEWNAVYVCSGSTDLMRITGFDRKWCQTKGNAVKLTPLKGQCSNRTSNAKPVTVIPFGNYCIHAVHMQWLILSLFVLYTFVTLFSIFFYNMLHC